MRILVAEDERDLNRLICRTLERAGYSVDAWEEVAAGKKSSDGRFSGPCYIAKKWTPFEISIVSVPADPTVGVGRSMEDGLGMTAWEAMIQINENQMRGGLMK